MEFHQKRREIFFSNLSLLGFDANYMGKKSSTVFNRDMFNVPNKAAFEVVTYFLFSKLNEVTNNEYKILWPLLDKKMSQEFRKACYEYLVKISKECSDGIQFPRIFPTLLLSPGGDRFYELYLAFSTYVMQMHIDVDKVCLRPLFSKLSDNKLQKIRKKSLKMTVIHRTNEFVETQHTALKHQEDWEKASENFEAYYRYIKNKILLLTSEKKEQLDILCKYCSVNADEIAGDAEKLAQATAKKEEKLQKILSMWKKVEELLHGEKALWDIVRSELDSECNEKMVLNGQQYMINMPEVLKVNYNKELREKKVQCLIENGKLSVKNFVNLWAISIKCYADAFEGGNLPDSVGMIPTLKNGIQLLEEYLNKAKLLSQRLLEIIHEERDEIEKLEEVVFSYENEQPSGFPPITPTFSFSPKASGRKSSILPDNYLSLTPNASKRFSLTRRKIEDFQTISPLHFNFQDSTTENRGHIKPGSEFCSLERSVIQKRFSGQGDGHFQNFYTSSVIQDLKETSSKPPDLFTSCFSEERSYHDDVNSIDSFHSKSEVSPSVERNISREILHQSGDLNNMFKDTEWNNDSKGPSYPGESLIVNESKICDTPPPSASYTFDLESIEKLKKISQHLNPKSDFTSKGDERYNFSHIIFSEEEMLDDMTLPPIPFF